MTDEEIAWVLQRLTDMGVRVTGLERADDGSVGIRITRLNGRN